MQARHESKTKLLDAALRAVRGKGYAATTVDDICAAAGVTKGSFFHHFHSKDELALAAIAHWNERTEVFFAEAHYRRATDPLDRLFGYLELRGEILTGAPTDYTCFLGTLVQETHATHPDIRAACDEGMAGHIAELTRDIEAARQLYAPEATWTAASLSYFIQAVLQGAFVFAKATQGTETARESLDHLMRYIEQLFDRSDDPRQGEKIL